VPGQGSRFVLRVREAMDPIRTSGSVEPGLAMSRARVCET
jgi:hypothetical protein